MKRNKTYKKYVESSSDSEEDRPLKKPSPGNSSKLRIRNVSSSSESDLENYLQRPEDIDLSSEFFSNTKKIVAPKFDSIEKSIFSGLTRLSDSDSQSEAEENKIVEDQPMTSVPETDSVPDLNASYVMNFDQFQNYTNLLENTKKQLETKLTEKQSKQENSIDILKLLANGENTNKGTDNVKQIDLHSSDFDSDADEDANWEEIELKSVPTELNNDKSIIPKKDLQIMINMPDNIKKKKGVDVVAAMKRRLNRIRKLNQILVHQVHLLGWIAHGNYVNASINQPQTLAMALSLLPNENAYPDGRTDLAYLEKIVNWYKKKVTIIEKEGPPNIDLDKCLQLQINQKKAYNKTMFVYIFIAILRAMGIQCRLILSLQVEPLRPPASEMHSLSTKTNDEKKKTTTSKKKGKQTSKIKPMSEDEIKLKRKIDELKKKKEIEQNNLKSDDKLTLSQKVTKSMSSVKRKSKKLETEPKELKKKYPEHDTVSKENTSDKKTKAPNLAKLQSNSTTKRQHFDKSNTVSKHLSKQRSLSEENRKTESENNKKTQFGTQVVRRSTRIKSMDGGNNKNEDNSTKDKQENNDSQVSARSKRRRKRTLPQVDGINDTSSDSEEDTDKRREPKTKLKKIKKVEKPNLRNIKKIIVKNKSPNNKKIEKGRTDETDSEEEFQASAGCSKSLTPMRNKTHQLDVRNDIISIIKGRIKEQRQLEQSKKVKNRKFKPPTDDSDSDYVTVEEKKTREIDSDDEFSPPKAKVKRRVQVPKKDQSVQEPSPRKIGNDVWIEVFLESEEKWITADIIHGQIHCVKKIYQRATHPIIYILAWNNNNNIKDVTQRYCPNFNTLTRKLRVDSNWWNDSLRPFAGVPTARDKEEDDDLLRQQMDQPLPKAISEYKNHPLYVLKRHLLKFEGIYPPQAPTVGFIRGEAVYPRSSVYLLHSRDIWLKQAKVVKRGETPYKIVKARPKYDKLSNSIITDQLLEIFGPWQVEDYEPPTAANGIVPRNAFGNVDLFKTCMLPKGTIHLQLPGINKTARKLMIDCAPAIVGFDFHGGWSHPVYDGYVVCKEFEEKLVDAWAKEQEELDRKEEEKIEKRVYGNWRKLIKGLLIRERLKKKYDFGEPSTSNKTKTSGKKSK